MKEIMKYLITIAILLIIFSCSNQDTKKNISKNKNDSLLAGEIVDIDEKKVVLSEKNEQYCIVGYTVTKEGFTKDVKTVDCPSDIFISASINAAKKFKFKPKKVDGEAVEVKGVTNRFTFTVQEDN